MSHVVVEVADPAERARVCEAIIRTLPGWFGIEEANRHYVEAARELTMLAVADASGAAGFATLKLHTPHAAEVYAMGVRPDLHRRGIGRALLAEAERRLLDAGVEYLQVKTLGPSRPDAGYARTRLFYEAAGFRALEELPDLWPANPCLLLVKRLGTPD